MTWFCLADLFTVHSLSETFSLGDAHLGWDHFKQFGHLKSHTGAQLSAGSETRSNFCVPVVTQCPIMLLVKFSKLQNLSQEPLPWRLPGAPVSARRVRMPPLAMSLPPRSHTHSLKHRTPLQRLLFCTAVSHFPGHGSRESASAVCQLFPLSSQPP